jgi:hypothetical protein
MGNDSRTPLFDKEKVCTPTLSGAHLEKHAMGLEDNNMDVDLEACSEQDVQPSMRRNTDWSGADSASPPSPVGPMPGAARTKVGPLGEYFLRKVGVKLSSNKNTVLSYNPRKLQKGLNFMVATWVLPHVFTRSLWVQNLLLILIAELAGHSIALVSHGEAVAMFLQSFFDTLSPLTTYVASLFVSLVLSNTYYANRQEFGSLFGRTLGLAQQCGAWIRPPPGSGDEGRAAANRFQQTLVRWGNATFRLLVLEARDLESEEMIGDDLKARRLLTEREWKHIEQQVSRASHIYQWMNNLLHELYDRKYIRDAVLLLEMQRYIDTMRAANVWGLPSLPIMYTLFVTIMIKLYLLTFALTEGTFPARNGDTVFTDCWYYQAQVVVQITLQNMLFQGLLDLHRVLYHPNKGTEVSHMPAESFLNFVETVSNAIIQHNQEENAPYCFDSIEQGRWVKRIQPMEEDTESNMQEAMDVAAIGAGLMGD